MKKKSMFGEGGLKTRFAMAKPLPVHWNKEEDKSIYSILDTITDEELKEQINEIIKQSVQEKNSK